MTEFADHVRRKDRQKSEPAFLHDLLRNSASCTIAVEKNGFPFIHVAFFVFDQENDEIIFHFSKHGHAGEEITNGKKAAISLYKYGKLYTAEKAVDFGCEYQSVILYGNIVVLTDENERMEGMRKFFLKFFNNVTEKYEPFTPQQANPIHVAKMKIEAWFGKEHLVPGFAKDSFYFPGDPVI
jgi:nitroimidazol reductase NimA-like FMN-containing flavoprotein (pyridoxamine 5'-phosphate oxidase superfamily)